MDQQHRLTAVLADGTRYGIYRSIVEQPGDEVTVAGVATRFALHPNVARMHLTKLERAGLLTTSLRKDGSGGRPARLYRLSDKVSVAQHAAAALRPALRPRPQGARRDRRPRHGRRRVPHRRRRRRPHVRRRAPRVPPPRPRRPGQGHARRRRRGRHAARDALGRPVLALDVRNCAFKELSSAQPDLVCVMHRAFLEGFIEQLAAAGGEVAIQASSAISRGDDRCHMQIAFADRSAQPSPRLRRVVGVIQYLAFARPSKRGTTTRCSSTT